jgi:transposase-like protein
MPTTKPLYATELKQQMVDLVRAGPTPAELGREFKCSAQSISTWVARDAGRSARVTAGSAAHPPR